MSRQTEHQKSQQYPFRQQVKLRTAIFTGLWIAAVSFWVLYVFRINCQSQTEILPAISTPDEIPQNSNVFPAHEISDTADFTSKNIQELKISDTSGVSQTKKQSLPFTGNCINVNTADATQLETLPGIGKVISQRIIEKRRECGKLAGPDDLLAVKGIGSVKLEKIIGFICF